MSWVLRGGRIFTPEGTLAEGDIGIDGNRISLLKDSSLRKDAQIVELSGRTVLPGFIDLHTHLTFAETVTQESQSTVVLRAAQRGRRALAAGITTVRDVGGYKHADLHLKRAVNRGWIPGPRIVASGQFIMMTGGHSYQRGVEADGPEEVRKAVRAQIKAGADWIKLMASGGVARVDESPDHPQLTLEEMAAAVHEARRAGKPVAAHAHPAGAIKDALQAGVKSIEHCTFFDDAALSLMRESGSLMVATLSVYEAIARSDRWPGLRNTAQRVLDHKLGSIKAAVEQGVPWGVGTDSGTYLPIDAYWRELHLLHQAGVSIRKVLLHATKVNADLLGLGEAIGTIENGKIADLVVLDGDPLEDISATARVFLVIRDGQVHWPNDLRVAEPE